MDLSIVIASYNTRHLTRCCLEAIRQQPEVKCEVIVVDNASADGTPEIIQREFPEVQLVCNSENRGFAAAQNIGLQRARSRNLLVLNSDVLVTPGALGPLVARLRQGAPELAAVGPQIRNSDGSLAPSARRALMSRPMIALGIVNRHFPIKKLLPPADWLRRHWGWLLARWHDNYAAHDAVKQVDYVDGMCVLFKREALEQTGLFDEQFFFDSEILDLSNRLRARGWRLEYFPGVRVIHHLHASRKQLSRIIVETHRSEFIYYTKYAPQLVPFVAYVVRMVVSFRRLLLRMALVFCPDDEERRLRLEYCDQILHLARQAATLAGRERIPPLVATETFKNLKP